jgi:hypothetical protein
MGVSLVMCPACCSKLPETTFSLASSRESNPAEVTVKGCLQTPPLTAGGIAVELRVETSGRVVGYAGRLGW